MNQQEEDQGPSNDDAVNIKTENNRRVQREAPKPKKEQKDDWGDDVENDLGL